MDALPETTRLPDEPDDATRPFAFDAPTALLGEAAMLAHPGLVGVCECVPAGEAEERSPATF